MRASRLIHALDSGAIVLPPDGSVAVLRPRAGDDLGARPAARLRLFQGFRPDYDALAAAGYRVAPRPEGSHAAAVVCLPRARAEAEALIARAARMVPAGAPVIVDGDKIDGVDALWRACRARVELSAALSKAHGRIFAFAAPDEAAGVFADWAERGQPRRLAGGQQVTAGVFSADGVDPGSAMLAAALPARLPARVVDLGAGWGYLSVAALARAGVERLDLVEAEIVALDCAKANVIDARARFHWADATRFHPEGAAGAVIMNPPFHSGRNADPALGAAFIAAAAGMLAPSGTLWMVANRHLPYHAALDETFREVEEIGGDSRFRLVRAARPRDRRARAA